MSLPEYFDKIDGLRIRLEMLKKHLMDKPISLDKDEQVIKALEEVKNGKRVNTKMHIFLFLDPSEILTMEDSLKEYNDGFPDMPVLALCRESPTGAKMAIVKHVGEDIQVWTI